MIIFSLVQLVFKTLIMARARRRRVIVSSQFVCLSVCVLLRNLSNYIIILVHYHCYYTCDS